jgi:hypothetical protein
MYDARISFLLAVLVVIASFTRALAISIGDVDTFTTGLDGWQKGQVNPTFLSVQGSGGPGGVGDAYMKSVADGSASFGRLTVFNQNQWNSNYSESGVTSIRMDLLNSGNVPLDIRLGLRNSVGAGFISTSPFLLGVGTNWTSADFPVTEASLTAVGSPGSYTSFLASGFALRILHATSTNNLNGNQVVSTLGIDNITAVPEPATCLHALAGLGFLSYSMSRCRNQSAA